MANVCDGLTEKKRKICNYTPKKTSTFHKVQLL